MKRYILFISPLVLFVLAFTFSSKPADTGKEIFTANKCGTCHSVAAEGIIKKGKGPDLSQIGDTVKSDWINKFLKKQVSMHGKQHPTAFKGNDNDLKTLSGWIVSLNAGKDKNKYKKGSKD